MANEYELSNRPFTLTCPECGGALNPPVRDPILRYTCHIGHRLTWLAMAEAQLARIEFLLCGSMTHIKERAELCRQLAEAGEIDSVTADRLIGEALDRAEKLKALLVSTWSQIPLK